MIVVWVVFLIISLILILVRFSKSFGKSFSSLICNIISCLISFGLARLCVSSMGTKGGKQFLEILENQYGKEMANFTSLEDLYTFLGSIIVGVLMFYVFYLLISIIITVIKHIFIYGKLEKAENQPNTFLERVAIIITNLASVALTFVVLITPVGFICNCIIPEESQKIPFVSSIYLDKLTEMPENENGVWTTDEIKYTLSAIDGLREIQTKEGINKVKVAICYKTHFLPTAVAELASTGASYWKNGEEFLGYAPEIPEGREGTLYKELFGIIEKWNKKAVTDDVKTILDVYSQMLDYRIEELSDGNGIVNALCKEEFTEELFVNLYKNEDFDQLIPVVIEYGLGTAFDYLDIDYDVTNFTKVDITKFSEEDVRREARLTADVVDVAKDIVAATDKIESGNIDLEDVEKIEEKLMKIKESKIVGDIAKELEFQIENLIEDFQF